MTELPPIPPTRTEVVAWVREHLGHLCCDDPTPSPAFVGGQRAADRALDDLDISGYARTRSTVHPPSARGASKMSPYIRHGLLQLSTVWQATNDAPGYDRFRYQGELLWQEYARHWYALFGRATKRPVAFEPPKASAPWPHDPWWREMRCIDATLDELETDGWCVNQTRMWLASQYSFRGHGDLVDGEDTMFRHLLDGSRAANRLGWQWTAGTSRSRAYGFARRQVLKRAPQFCAECSLQDDCPIRAYAKAEPRSKVTAPLAEPVDDAFGPLDSPQPNDGVESVWLTAESLGVADPALAAHPGVPAVFVFDEPLLTGLQLSGKRLIFLAETLAELGELRDLAVHLGDPGEVLSDRSVAVTYAPVPGFAGRAARAREVELHPWPWLRPPTEALGGWFDRRADKMPSFRDWCELTKPVTARRHLNSDSTSQT